MLLRRRLRPFKNSKGSGLIGLIILRALGNTKILPAKEAAVPVAPELVVPATAEASTNV